MWRDSCHQHAGGALISCMDYSEVDSACPVEMAKPSRVWLSPNNVSSKHAIRFIFIYMKFYVCLCQSRVLEPVSHSRLSMSLCELLTSSHVLIISLFCGFIHGGGRSLGVVAIPSTSPSCSTYFLCAGQQTCSVSSPELASSFARPASDLPWCFSTLSCRYLLSCSDLICSLAVIYQLQWSITCSDLSPLQVTSLQILPTFLIDAITVLWSHSSP